MDYDKKVIAKEDGRYLIFYHFRETASPEQTAAFESAESFDAVEASQADAPVRASAKAIEAGVEGNG